MQSLFLFSMISFFVHNLHSLLYFINFKKFFFYICVLKICHSVQCSAEYCMSVQKSLVQSSAEKCSWVYCSPDPVEQWPALWVMRNWDDSTSGCNRAVLWIILCSEVQCSVHCSAVYPAVQCTLQCSVACSAVYPAHWPMADSRCMVECLLFYAFLLILYSQGLISWSLENVW